jgi:hypothetical protein
MTIVVYAHRYKRPPPKKKLQAVEIATTVVVHVPKQAIDKKRPVAKPRSAGTFSRPRCHHRHRQEPGGQSGCGVS